MARLLLLLDNSTHAACSHLRGPTADEFRGLQLWGYGNPHVTCTAMCCKAVCSPIAGMFASKCDLEHCGCTPIGPPFHKVPLGCSCSPFCPLPFPCTICIIASWGLPPHPGQALQGLLQGAASQRGWGGPNRKAAAPKGQEALPQGSLPVVWAQGRVRCVREALASVPEHGGQAQWVARWCGNGGSPCSTTTASCS